MQWWPIFQPVDGNDRYRDRQIAADRSVIHMMYKHQTVYYERPPKPPTIRNSFTRTLVLDTVMKLSGTIGVTQKKMTLTHMFASF